MAATAHAERIGARARAGRISWSIDRHGGYLLKLIRRLAHRVRSNEARMDELEQAISELETTTFDRLATVENQLAVVEARLRLREARLRPPS